MAQRARLALATNMAIAINAALADAGLVVMPRESSADMKLSGARSIGKTMGVENHTERARQCWQAMTAVALEEAEAAMEGGHE